MASAMKGLVGVFSALTYLECSRTGAYYGADQVQSLSDVGAPLLCRYDLERVAAMVTREQLARRPPTLWRYYELLPVRAATRVVSLGEGMTPLLSLPRWVANSEFQDCA